MGKPLVIVGAGLVGSLLATRLAKIGFDVEVFEKRLDPRKTTAEGRSINLALSHRGIRSLKEAEVFDRLEPDLIPMHGRIMHDIDGDQTHQPYGQEGQFINSVSRHDLNGLLIREAEHAGAIFHFGHELESIDFTSTQLTFSSGGSKRLVGAEAVFATDGAFSIGRKCMKEAGVLRESVDFISHSYKELRLEPVSNDYQLDPEGLHIWPRGKHMLIALPNPDKSFTCTLFLDTEQMNGFDQVGLRQFFDENFPDFSNRMDDLSDQFFTNPTGSLVTVKCSPWYHNKVLLIGDAAHAIVPFYGQGMNAGFEDVRILCEHLSAEADWATVFQEFGSSRKKDGDAIADLALKNFMEMRDWVGDERFLKRKKVEAELHEQFPDKWLPQYSMVTFSDIPYSEAKNLGDLQDQVMKEADLFNPSFTVLIDRFEQLKGNY